MRESKHRQGGKPPCGTCNGSGKVYRSEYDRAQKKSVMKLVNCPTCNGRG